MKALIVLLAMGAAALGCGAPATADSRYPTLPPDSTTAPLSCPTLELEQGGPTCIALAAFQTTGFVRVIYPDGREELLGGQKIRALKDVEGRDRTRFVLEQRGTIGSIPTGYRGDFDPASSKKAGTATSLVVTLGFAAVVVLLAGYASMRANGW